jgi:hypothetical protein
LTTSSKGAKDTKEGPSDKLKRGLSAEIHESEWSKLYRATSQPFDLPKSRKIAVKMINPFDDKVLKVYSVTANGKRNRHRLGAQADNRSTFIEK